MVLPAHWASALINGDYSGCADTEENEIKAWLKDFSFYGPCLTCSEYPEITQFNGLITECLTYTFPVIYYRTNEAGINYLLYPVSVKTDYLPWQKLGLSYTASGYGRQIPTDKMILLCGKWRRVYCTIYSNIGSCWIVFQGKKINVESALSCSQ